MAIIVPVYSEQPLTADAQKVIAKVLEDYPPKTFEFKDVSGGFYYPGMGMDILTFGTISPANKGSKFDTMQNPVYTYSVAQLTTKANAVSVLKAALNRFYLPKKVHPQKIVLGSFDRFNFDEPIAIDIETSGNLGKVHTPEEVGILTVSFYQENKWAVSAQPYTTEFKEILRKVKYPIWHNGKFDIRVIDAQLQVRVPNYFDTMLAHHVLNQAAGDHKLKNLARRYLGAPEWEADLKQWTVGGAHYENIPLSKLIEYNAWDVYWTYELWKYLEPQILADENSSSAFMLEMAASDLLLEVEQYGFKVDVQRAEELKDQMTLEVATLLQDIRTSLSQLGYVDPKGRDFNPGSWQQVQQVISHLENVPYTGSTDEKSLTKIKQGPRRPATVTFIDKLLAYRKTTKALSTYVLGVLNNQREGRVRTTFLIHGTSTGRLSSSGPNIQNIPRDKTYRSLYIG